MSDGPSRRRVLAALPPTVALAGCVSPSVTTPVGYHLRNYSDDPQTATVVLETAFGRVTRTHDLQPVREDGTPHVVEREAVAKVLRSREYTVRLRLDGTEVARHVATADCPAGESSSDEQLDLDIGWGNQPAHRSRPTVDIADPSC